MKSVNIACLVTILFAAALSFSCASTGGDAVTNEGYRWNFADPGAGTAGWTTAPDEFWDFKGTIDLSRDDTFLGRPMLRVDVDFSGDVGSWWSEPKLKYDFDETFELRGLNRFAFDMYFNPRNATAGSFKGKVIFLYNTGTVLEAELDSILATEEAGDYLKASVVFRFRSTRSINSLRLGIVGAVTDYKGPIFIDNLRLE